MRSGIGLLMLTASLAAPVLADDGEDDARLMELIVEFRREFGPRNPIAPNRAARLKKLEEIARVGSEKAFVFLVDLARGSRHADLLDGLIDILFRHGKFSHTVADFFKDHLREDSPYRLTARDFLIRHAEHHRVDQTLYGIFDGGATLDRFMALRAMGNIKSDRTLERAWILLRNKRWKAVPGTPMTCGTIAYAVRGFEGVEAARLLMLLRRDERFASQDLRALRDATRLWAQRDLRKYVKVSQLGHPDAAEREKAARFMGDAGIEAARAPLLLMARDVRERVAVRAAATEALGGLRIARGDLARKLASLLQDGEGDVQRAAVRGLGRLRVRDAAKALVSLIGSPLDNEARAALAEAYGHPRDHDWAAWLATANLPDGT